MSIEAHKENKEQNFNKEASAFSLSLDSLHGRGSLQLQAYSNSGDPRAWQPGGLHGEALKWSTVVDAVKAVVGELLQKDIPKDKVLARNHLGKRLTKPRTLRGCWLHLMAPK